MGVGGILDEEAVIVLRLQRRGRELVGLWRTDEDPFFIRASCSLSACAECFVLRNPNRLRVELS